MAADRNAPDQQLGGSPRQEPAPASTVSPRAAPSFREPPSEADLSSLPGGRGDSYTARLKAQLRAQREAGVRGNELPLAAPSAHPQQQAPPRAPGDSQSKLPPSSGAAPSPAPDVASGGRLQLTRRPSRLRDQLSGGVAAVDAATLYELELAAAPPLHASREPPISTPNIAGGANHRPSAVQRPDLADDPYALDSLAELTRMRRQQAELARRLEEQNAAVVRLQAQLRGVGASRDADPHGGGFFVPSAPAFPGWYPADSLGGVGGVGPGAPYFDARASAGSLPRGGASFLAAGRAAAGPMGLYDAQPSAYAMPQLPLPPPAYGTASAYGGGYGGYGGYQPGPGGRPGTSGGSGSGSGYGGELPGAGFAVPPPLPLDSTASAYSQRAAGGLVFAPIVAAQSGHQRPPTTAYGEDAFAAAAALDQAPGMPRYPIAAGADAQLPMRSGAPSLRASAELNASDTSAGSLGPVAAPFKPIIGRGALPSNNVAGGANGEDLTLTWVGRGRPLTAAPGARPPTSAGSAPSVSLAGAPSQEAGGIAFARTRAPGTGQARAPTPVEQFEQSLAAHSSLVSGAHPRVSASGAGMDAASAFAHGASGATADGAAAAAAPALPMKPQSGQDEPIAAQLSRPGSPTEAPAASASGGSAARGAESADVNSEEQEPVGDAPLPGAAPLLPRASAPMGRSTRPLVEQSLDSSTLLVYLEAARQQPAHDGLTPGRQRSPPSSSFAPIARRGGQERSPLHAVPEGGNVHGASAAMDDEPEQLSPAGQAAAILRAGGVTSPAGQQYRHEHIGGGRVVASPITAPPERSTVSPVQRASGAASPASRPGTAARARPTSAAVARPPTGAGAPSTRAGTPQQAANGVAASSDRRSPDAAPLASPFRAQAGRTASSQINISMDEISAALHGSSAAALPESGGGGGSSVSPGGRPASAALASAPVAAKRPESSAAGAATLIEGGSRLSPQNRDALSPHSGGYDQDGFEGSSAEGAAPPADAAAAPIADAVELQPHGGISSTRVSAESFSRPLEASTSSASITAAAELDTTGKYTRRNSWGLSADEVALHQRRLLAFYAVHAPAKANSGQVQTAWELFGPRIWNELERKYRGKTVGFRPMPTDGSISASASFVAGTGSNPESEPNNVSSAPAEGPADAGLVALDAEHGNRFGVAARPSSRSGPLPSSESTLGSDTDSGLASGTQAHARAAAAISTRPSSAANTEAAGAQGISRPASAARRIADAQPGESTRMDAPRSTGEPIVAPQPVDEAGTADTSSTIAAAPA